MNELYCCHAVQNPASGAVMKKVGFVYTHNSDYEKFNGEKVQCLCYKLTPKTFIAESL